MHHAYEKCLLAPTINHRTLNAKKDALSDALKSLNSHHTAWVAKAGLSNEELAEERYSQTWLEAEWDVVDDLQNQADDELVKDLPTELSEARNMQ